MPKTQHDPVAEFFAEAATSIRHELVERAWFGRAVTPANEAREQPMDEQLGWSVPGEKSRTAQWDGLCQKLEQERGHQPAPEPDHDHEMDR